MSESSLTKLAVALSFGSIAALLAHLWRLAPMWLVGAAVTLPCILGLVAIHLVARRRGYTALDQGLTVAWLGGWWGTLGYDLIRVPLHLLGFNPFPPIRSYGLFLVDGAHSTLLSDLVGTAYHFSNGLSFAVPYVLLMAGRHWGWAVLWGLLLETFAVVTPFGAVYGIRTAVLPLSIAYFAHLYYGFPLGLAARDPAATLGWVGKRRRLLHGGASVLTALVVGVLVFGWEPVTAPRPAPGTVALGPEAIVSGWTRADIEDGVVLRNLGESALTWTIGERSDSLAPGAQVTVELPVGIHRIAVEEQPWRSAGIIVERDGYPCEPGTW